MRRGRGQISRRVPVFVALLTSLWALVSPDARAHLNDDFSRPDAAALGNGWIEKNPAAFSLSSGSATKLAVSTGYRDNLVYRPAGEDVRDVEASVEFQISSTAVGYPQIAVRVQSATVATANTLDGYLLYIPNSTTSAVLGRQRGSDFVVSLANLNFTEALNTAGRYRLRLAARGANPVQLSGFVERFDGAIWVVIASASVLDGSWARIDSAGSVGFGGFVEASYSFDRFARIDLSSTGTLNPAPTTVELSPSLVETGESGLTVFVYGSGFTSDSVAQWNGAARPTTYSSPSELLMEISEQDLAVPVVAQITVLNPSPGGGGSNPQSFTVAAPSAPPPVITSLTPASVVAGTGDLTLTVTGSNFDPTATFRWGGVTRPTTYVSASELRVAISAADVSFPGTVDVRVTRGSQSSPNVPFTVSPIGTNGFYDNFNRADGAAVGNGWLEKTAAAFTISGNGVGKPATGADYRDNIVYRPAAEDMLNVEAAIELRLLNSAVGYPQVLTRIQPGSAGSIGQLDAYLLFLPNTNTQAVIARNRGNEFTTWLTSFNLSTPINTSDRYRLRLRAQGTATVMLSGYVERWTGSGWQIIGQGSASDSSAVRIATAGSVGFGGHTESTYRYDNFSRLDLTGEPIPNPVPVLSSLSPASAAAGSGAFTVSVTGSNFVENSTVRWNGVDRPTTYVSPTQLSVAISNADISAQGTASVAVFNGAPGGGSSSALAFSILAPLATNPTPVVANMSPNTAVAGSSAVTITVNGSNFVNGSVVRWNGSNRATTYVSNVRLTATITQADLASVGNSIVTVFSPTPGGGTSGGLNFAVTSPPNPPPSIASLSPSSAPVNGPAFTLSVSGSNFVNGAVVRWNGANRPTSYVSATQLDAEISAADISTSGTVSVTVVNPAPGGGTSPSQTFTITVPSDQNPLPVLESLSQSSWPTGGGSLVLAAYGSGFTPQSVVHWNGSQRATTFVSASELRASIPSSDVLVPGPASISVTTPSPGGGASVPLTLLVQDGSAQFFVDSFNRPDSAVVGNGWNEKDPNAFSIAGRELVSATTLYGFPYNILYRPAAEARMDAETSVEIRRLPNVVGNLSQANFPQLHARVQSDSVATPGSVDSYLFFLWDTQNQPQAAFAINRALQPGVRYECFIRTIPLSEALVTGGRYRLRFRVLGSAPVRLLGSVERYINGAWTVIASGTASHDVGTVAQPGLPCDGDGLPAPITTAGVSGVAKWENRTDAYDNFYWREATAADMPTVSNLSPASAPAGSAGLTLTVNGTGFRPDSVVYWYGSARPTTFVSTTQVRATLTAADLARAGNTPVTVTGDMGQSSAEVFFNVAPVGGTVSFDDSFNRANGAVIGNGWVEKTPSAFDLDGGRVYANFGNSDFRDNLLSRPPPENRLNVEASVDLQLRWRPVGYPMVVTRLQNATAADAFDGYLLLLNNDPGEAVIGRQRTTDAYYTTLATITLSQPVVEGSTYRLRLSTTGTTAVTIQGTVERLAAGAWQTIGTATVVDSSPQRIATAGSVGVSTEAEDSYSFDNFRRVDLP